MPAETNPLLSASQALARLEGEYATLQRQDADLVTKVGQAKGRLLLRDEVTEVLDLLQRRSHERGVGVYQRLLTAIMHDVFPDNTAQVKLALGTERGSPALDIELEADGEREDVLEGNGGALTNVISTGLRYVALAQLRGHRKFVLLDEPDCWIAPANIPQFVGVLTNLTQTASVQTLLITHHDTTHVPPEVGVVRLMLHDGVPEAVLEGAPPVWDKTQPGIRYIRMVNTRRHRDTLIPLYPGVTVLAGPNNAGKSVVAAAMTAISAGESKDSLIRHKADKCVVTVGLENDLRLVYTRVRQGSPKVVCALYQGEDPTPLHEEALSRGGVPDWVTKYLGVQRVNELDIQLSSQKSPIFLLDERSPSTRASILAIGKEASHLHALMAAYQRMVKNDRDTALRGEREIAALRLRIAALATLPDVRARYSAVSALQEELTQASSALDKLTELVRALSTAQELAAGHEARRKLMASLPSPPQIEDVRPLSALVDALAGAKRLAATRLPAKPDLPELQDTDALARMVAGLELANLRIRHKHALASVIVPESPALEDLTQLTAMIARLDAQVAHAQVCRFEQGLLRDELAELEVSWPTCPTCHSLIQSPVHHHD
jgi:energy-coupling factor transporter ATP-binding protein EcfA2